jgi:dTDP-glucose pyrophosphorylase
VTDRPDDYWRKALLPLDSTIQQAIRNLDESALKITLVVSQDLVLIGTITDGDIRRGLLRGLSLTSTVDSLVHREAFVVPPEMGREMVLHLMRVNKFPQLPVDDADRRVVGLHVWDEITAPPARSHAMVIMAGGRGTRLWPHTEHCPKPMLPVAGTPMLERIIVRAKGEGFHHFVIAIHYLGHLIEEYFADGDRWQVKIEYLREESPLGTAGALTLLSPLPDRPFLVSNGDVLTDIRYGELLDFHVRHQAAATMAVRLHEWQHPFGVVRTKGVEIVGFEEKPVSQTHVNGGVYVLEPRALQSLHRSEACDMPILFERLQAQGLRTVAYPMHEPWLDVGRLDDLRKANGPEAPIDS